MKNLITILFTLSVMTVSMVVAQVPTNGLVAYYPCNGNANDESGNGNNGTNNGATLTTDRFGKENSAYSFNGVDNYILTKNSTFLQFDNSDFTISVWFNSQDLSKPVRFLGAGYQVSNGLLSVGIGTNPAYWGSGIRANVVFQNESRDFNSLSELDVTIGKWNNLTVVRSSSFLTYYLNGVSIGGLPIKNTVAANPVSPLIIGARNENNTSQIIELFNGQLDDIRIYNRALTINEVLALNNECQNTSSVNVLSTCVSYTWNDVTYTKTGVHTKTGLKNKAGCDSTATLDLTILNASTSTTIESACVSYTWNDVTYTKTGIYTKTGLKNKVGCDSTATLNLTINPLPIVSFTLPTLLYTTNENLSLIGTPTGGIFYGLGISNNQLNPKIGKLGQRNVKYNYTDDKGCTNTVSRNVIIVDSVGNYCSVEDTLYILTTVTNVNNVIVSNTIKIYPNPASDFLIIDNGNVEAMNGYSVQIVNTLGQKVFESAISTAEFKIDLSTWVKNSLYVVKLMDSKGNVIETKKIIVK